MSLVRSTNSTWTEVDRNIKFLENAGIVESRFLQNQRLIKLKQKSSKVEAVLKALRILEMANLTQSIM
jgi:predicted transcriptional regulator